MKTNMNEMKWTMDDAARCGLSLAQADLARGAAMGAWVAGALIESELRGTVADSTLESLANAAIDAYAAECDRMHWEGAVEEWGAAYDTALTKVERTPSDAEIMQELRARRAARLADGTVL